MSDSSSDVAHLMEVGFGFWPAKVLLTAVELEVFTKLSDRSMTGEELGRALALHPRGIWDFLDALVALGFLERDGDGVTARYSNTAATAQFLDKNLPSYIGGILEMCSHRLFRFWADLGEALQTGRPQNEVKHTGKSIFEALYANEAGLEQFMSAMRGISAPNFQALAEKFDFSKYRTLCDVGGATALLSTLVASRHPHLQCVSFDLPPVEPIARRWIAKASLSDRVQAVSGNFFEQPLPQADVITMGLILHDWNLEKKRHLIRLAYEALPPDGAFIAIENLIDDARRENAFGLMMSLNMLIEFGDAFDFTGADFWSWCQPAGFRRYEVLPLAGACSAAIAYK
ncbi:methyltransferase/methylase [Steroidobacter agaridevorans]|uniref:Methyltransferase/methylase n=1 Tax=Steroidobacter agaridevorans TaxID=2695856 RepID=A0A829YLN1_9GAMM|nr:methyltransferase [Steroidobacter agaridevorans]GFE84109.1 methyltransferase/methylase [Steroidobacter agaridevorans]